MPYNKLADLPDSVKKLPKAAQGIWMDAFNSSYKHNKCEWMVDEKKQKECETTCFKIAWGAVKRNYYKDEKSGKWKEKEFKD